MFVLLCDVTPSTLDASLHLSVGEGPSAGVTQGEGVTQEYIYFLFLPSVFHLPPAMLAFFSPWLMEKEKEWTSDAIRSHANIVEQTWWVRARIYMFFLRPFFFLEFSYTHRVFRLVASRGDVNFINLVTNGRPRVKWRWMTWYATISLSMFLFYWLDNEVRGFANYRPIKEVLWKNKNSQPDRW